MRPRIKFCGGCGQDLDAPGADLKNGTRVCRPCENAKRRKTRRHGTGISTADPQAYKREYMKRWRTLQKKGHTPAGKPSKWMVKATSEQEEWTCCDTPISCARAECPFCGRAQA